MCPKDQIITVFGCMAESDFKNLSPHYKKDLIAYKDARIDRQFKLQSGGTYTCRTCTQNIEERTSDYLCAKDFNVQSRNMELLMQSNWYFNGMSSQQAKLTLGKSDVGTFLVRDSSDPNFLFSVSVKTPRGPTSVRVSYSKGFFQLDCDVNIKSSVPKFDSIVSLVDYYVRLGLNEHNKCRWLESSGRKDLPIVLKNPKVNGVTDLKHMCRLTINRTLPVSQKKEDIAANIDKINLPRPLSEYLKYYPHLH